MQGPDFAEKVDSVVDSVVAHPEPQTSGEACQPRACPYLQVLPLSVVVPKSELEGGAESKLGPDSEPSEPFAKAIG